MPNSDQTNEIKQSLQNVKNVYEVSPSLVIVQEEKEGGYGLMTLMKNEHHLMVCQLMPEEEKEAAAPEGVVFQAGSNPMGGKAVTGDPDAVREWAENYAVTGAKICVAFPYADAREAGSSGGVLSGLFD